MIKLIVNKQELSIVTQKVVSGTHNYLTVAADFKGDDWTGLRKWVHFTMGPYSYVLPMANNKITASAHLDLTEGTWEVYVHGNLLTDDEVTERITTDIKYLYVDAPHDGHPFPPLTPDFEEMLANQVAEANEISQSIRNDADTGVFDGATYLPAVSEEGVISWTNDKEKPNPSPQSIKGPKGDTGDSGVYIGTTEPTDPVKKVWINPEGGVGKVITGIETTGTHMPGTYDTYTFNFSDGTSLTFQIYNGADGSGIGDMLKSVYDTHNNATDVFDAIAAAVSGKASTSDLAAVATSGSYNDLSDKPTIPALPTVDIAMSNSSENAVQNKVIKAYVDSLTSGNFIATQSNTYAEIAAALNAGKMVYYKVGDAYIPYSYTGAESFGETSRHYFLKVTRFTVSRYYVDANDDWGAEHTDNITMELMLNSIEANSSYPVKSSVIASALAGKQNTLTIDSAMSDNSMNPVQNKAIKQYIDTKGKGYVGGIGKALNQENSSITVPANSATLFSVNISPPTGCTIVRPFAHVNQMASGLIVEEISGGVMSNGTVNWQARIRNVTNSDLYVTPEYGKTGYNQATSAMLWCMYYSPNGQPPA